MNILLFSTVFSVFIAVLVLIGNRGMLRLMFGKVEDSVMQACITYLKISAYSYPALAVYNAGAAAYRSLGKTSVTMYLSVASNIINVVGNVIGVFVLHAGVAWPSLIARTFSAVVITALCFRKKNEVVYRVKWICRWNWDLMKRILKVAVPNGIENGIFQLVKVALSSIVALFGTYQIAANGVAQSIWSMAAFPFSGALSNGLRAAGDVKFTMYVSIASTIFGRLLLSYLLGITFHMGVIGIAIAMVCDWIIRAVIFIGRQKSGKWKSFQVI